MNDKTIKADLMVVQLDRARTALAEAKTIGETKKVLDMAHAAEIYAHRQKLGEEAIGYAHSIKSAFMVLSFMLVSIVILLDIWMFVWQFDHGSV